VLTQLGSGYTVSGKIVGSSGGAISGATVRLKQGASIQDITTSASTGRWTFSNLTVGIYTIQAARQYYNTNTSAPFTLSSNLGGVDVTLLAEGEGGDPIDLVVPTISGHPQGANYTQSSAARPLVVTASAGEESLSYQWYSNTTNNNSSGIALGAENGAQTASYTPSTAATGTVYYYVVVFNSNADVQSDTANIRVNTLVNAAQPSINSPPQAADYTQNEVAIPLSVSASSSDGGALSYQWYRNTVNSNSGGTALVDLANGAQTASYTPSSATVGTLYYYVEVSNTKFGIAGFTSAKTASLPAAVVVTQVGLNISFSGLPTDETITMTPSAGTLSWSANTAFTITVTAAFESYTWYVDGVTLLSNSSAYTMELHAGEYPAGAHSVAIKVLKDGNPFSKQVNFVIAE
jgi:hypothetical protein